MFGLMPFENRRRDSISESLRLADEIEKRFFDRGTAAGRTDIYDCGNAYVLETELPGFDREDISVDIDGNILSIRAEKKDCPDPESGEKNYICCERRQCAVFRAFDISETDGDGVSAEYKNGVLKLTLPKKEVRQKTRRLEIRQN